MKDRIENRKIYRAALVHPHDDKYHYERDLMNRISGVEGYENFPNLGLLSIAPFFLPPLFDSEKMEAEWELTYIDEDYLKQNSLPRNYLEEDFDLVCLTAMNHQSYQAYRIGDHFKGRGIHTIMGGMHASALPDEALEHFDTVVVGEGEEVMSEFLSDFVRGETKKIYRATGKTDISTYPPPAFEIVPNLSWYNKIPLFATRGCPRSCEFCCLGEVYGPKYRKKAPEQVADEIRRVKELYPNPFISFADENMFADKKWSKKLAEALIPLNVRWEAYCDVSVADDEELLDLLYQSGCVELLIGFETIDVRNLKITDPWKARQVEQYGEKIKRIQDHGIGILACFVVGFDFDDKNTFKRLRNFLYENPLFELDIATLTPMPGTRLHKRLKEEGRLYYEKWDDYTWFYVNFQPMRLTPGEITEGIKWIFKEFTKPELEERRMKLFRKIEERMPDLSGRNAPKEI